MCDSHPSSHKRMQAAKEELEYLGDVQAQLHMLQAGAEGDLQALQGIQVDHLPLHVTLAEGGRDCMCICCFCTIILPWECLVSYKTMQGKLCTALLASLLLLPPFCLASIMAYMSRHEPGQEHNELSSGSRLGAEG